MMIITIINEAEGEFEAMKAAFGSALRWSSGYNADIYVNPRKADGWLEYHVIVKRKEDNTRYMTIGMIQRDIGQPYEFHS